MKWTILKEDEPYVVPSTGKKQRRVIAQCECGTIKPVLYTYIKSGRSKSCGCWTRDNWKTINLKHNHTKTTEYRIWCNMKTRCTNPNVEHYKNYGGRGITICKQWLESFEQFYKDMGKRPEGKTLDRIDNNKGYEPSNCKWSTYSEQARNRRNRYEENYI